MEMKNWTSQELLKMYPEAIRLCEKATFDSIDRTKTEKVRNEAKEYGKIYSRDLQNIIAEMKARGIY